MIKIQHNRRSCCSGLAGTCRSNQAEAPIPNRQELIAAVSAAIAEEAGTDISKIRILSVAKYTAGRTGVFLSRQPEHLSPIDRSLLPLSLP